MRAQLVMKTQRQWSNKAIARTAPCLMALFSLVCLFAIACHFQNHEEHTMQASASGRLCTHAYQ
jgi:hypothetical protein